MDIINDTSQEAKVRVSGGGQGVAPKGRPYEDDEDPSNWPLLSPGGLLNHSPLTPGPWTVCFVVNGRRITTQIRSASSKVRLTPEGKAFRVQVD
jgi:hypothetical protein